MKAVASSAACLLLTILTAGGARGAESCDAGLPAAAAKNAASLSTLAWAPFGRPEAGWVIYAPRIAEEIQTSCPPASPAFAAHLAAWQSKHQRAATGVMDSDTFLAMRMAWQARRPFVMASRHACPASPDEATLARADARESYGGKTILLLPDALAAYRRMVAAAHADLPSLSAEPRLLTIFSAYRSPAYDAARCLRDQNCQGIVRATCSDHRTGNAMDLYLGAAPGFAPDSTDDVNRLYLSRTPAYQWLIHNAGRFGFVNYAFEPWHWEFIGSQ